MSSSSRQLTYFERKLNQLTEFNPALIYNQDPEYSVDELDVAEATLHACDQYKDMLAAYTYAQDIVLPLFKTKSFTPNDFIYHLMQIHARMAKAMEKDANRRFTPPGKYAEKAGQFYLANIIHFQQGINFGENLKYYIQNLMSLEQFIKKGTALGLTPAEITNFLRIFKAAKYNIEALAEQVHAKTLSEEDQLAVARIIKFSIHRENIPQKMLAFASEFIKRFQTVRVDKKEEITELAFFILSNLIDIHCFFNVNKRVSICILNIFLRALNQPSLVLRYPSYVPTEHDYSKAIEHMDTQPEILKALLLHRLNHPEFTDDVKCQAVVHQVAMLDAYTQLQNEQKNKETAAHFEKLLSTIGNSVVVEDQMKVHRNNPLRKSPDYAKLLCLPFISQIIVTKLQDECGRIKEAKIRQKMQTEIENYVKEHGLTKAFKALLDAIEDKQYSRALRTVCNSTANETHLLKIVSLLTKYSSFITIDKNEKAGKQSLSAMDYAEQRQHVNVLAYLRMQLKTPTELNEAARKIQHFYQAQKTRFFQEKKPGSPVASTQTNVSVSSDQKLSFR